MDEFVYVKPVEGFLVPRYSTLRSSTTTFIGAVRDGKKLRWTLDAVVRIPRAEWTRYLKEYNRTIAEGSLLKATEADFKNWETQRAVAEQAIADGIKAEAEKEAANLAEPIKPEPESPASAGDKKSKKKSSKSDEGELE